jgi:hypothetical protein
VGAVLGAGEDQCPVVAGREGRHDGRPVSGGDRQQVVDRGRRRGGRIDRVLGRLMQETANQHVHGIVEGRGEQHPLAVWRGVIEQSPHDGEEAEVGHVVSLIDDGDLDVTQMAVPLTH